MASLNSVCLIGNLAAEPELKYTQSGKAVCSFRLAVNGWKKDDTLFVGIVAWDKTAEACGQYLAKGSTAAVQGRLQMRSWEDKQGQKRTVYEVVANAVQFLSKKSESRGNPPEDPDGEEVPF